MDYASLLYDPVYSVLGVPATLTLEDERTFSVTVLDKTAGVEVGGFQDNRERASYATVQTVLPAAVVRASEFAGIDLADLEDAALAFNGKTWRVKSYQPKPSPKGEADGELYLLLSEK